MFDIFSPVKKIVGIGKKKDNSEEGKKEEQKDPFLNRVSSFINKKSKDFIEEYSVIRVKMKDLSKTNYDLGMLHLKNGNISEARFRFWITKKFWPRYYDAYYQLAYCQILLNKSYRAIPVIKELLEMDPSYKGKIVNFLDSIEDEFDRSEIDNLIK